MRQGFDNRDYVTFDRSMPENVKIIGLTDAAFRAFVELICYSARIRSDGQIPNAALNRYALDITKELQTAGLLEPDQDAWVIHDYLKHQRSAREIDDLTEGRRVGGSFGAHTRWHVARRVNDPKCEFCGSG